MLGEINKIVCIKGGYSFHVLSLGMNGMKAITQNDHLHFKLDYSNMK